jgi:hypothetical protein
MASLTPPENPVRPLARLLGLPIETLKYVAKEPILTGSLLYILTRGRPHIRERVLRPFQNNLLSKNGAARIASLVTILKFLTTVGVLKRLNKALNRLALNNWTFGRPGAPFRFGSGKEELVVITGGSSGFGYEMVKSFSKVARVVVLDISAFPPELARCKTADRVEKTCTDPNFISARRSLLLL